MGTPTHKKTKARKTDFCLSVHDIICLSVLGYVKRPKILSKLITFA